MGETSGRTAADLNKAIEDAQAEASKVLSDPWKIPLLKKKDPELVKAFSRISARLIELRLWLGIRADSQVPVQALESILRRIHIRLGRDAAWDIAEDLQKVLLYVAPDEHLSSLLEKEWSRSDGERIKWTTLYSKEELDSLRKQAAGGNRNATGSPPWRDVVIDRLTTLYEQRTDSWRHDRANEQLRTNYLFAVTVVLGVALALASGLTVWQGKPFKGPVSTNLLTAMAAGALGSVLSGVFKLRDEMMSIGQLRSFWPVLTAQPFVGATAGTLLFAVLASGLIRIADLDPAKFSWQQYTVFGFLAGFSEPFFLGVVKRVAGLADQETKASPKAKTLEKRPPPDGSPDQAKPSGTQG